MFRLSVALAGALLLDLFAEGFLTVVADKVLAGDCEHAPSKGVVDRIRNYPTTHGLGFWIDVLAFSGLGSVGRTTASLVEKRLIAYSTSPLPIRARYVFVDARLRLDVVNKLIESITADRKLDLQSISLIAMAAACGTIDPLFPRRERDAIRERVSTLIQLSSTQVDFASLTNPRTVIVAVYEAVQLEAFGRGGPIGN